MAEGQEKSIIGYHYTNSEAFNKIFTGCAYGKKGLIPLRRFIALNKGGRLPDEAREGVIEGLLEPEPESWLKNPEFPHLWNYLMHDICRKKEIMLLSFEFNPIDKAYVVERAFVEKELCKPNPDRKSMNKAFKKYWESRVPVFEYEGGYSLPQLAIWSPIEFERLKVVWVKDSDEIWERTIKNDW